MERMDEEAERQESAPGGAGPIGRLGTERGQKARQQTKWPKGRFGQKPEEENRRPSQRATSARQSPEKLIEIVIASICARFGDSGHWSGGLRHPGLLVAGS
jgi:hypothetical protein